MRSFSFWPIILAQMLNTDSDSEQSYNLNDSEFNHFSSYLIEVEDQACKMGVKGLHNCYSHVYCFYLGILANLASRVFAAG